MIELICRNASADVQYPLSPLPENMFVLYRMCVRCQAFARLISSTPLPGPLPSGERAPHPARAAPPTQPLRPLPSSSSPSGQAGFWAPAAAFFEVTSGHVRLVAQQQQPPRLLAFVKHARLLLHHP